MIDPVFSESPKNTQHPLELGTILLIDKPAGWTSFDVVNKIRGSIKHHLGLKKIKVGHSGTLDPMATGLLLLGTGKCTRDLASLQELGKCYEGTITLGATTPTYDAESEPDELFPFQHNERSSGCGIDPFSGRINADSSHFLCHKSGWTAAI